MEESQELIVVEQLPIIKERLKKVSAEIDKEVTQAKSIVCTEENIKAVKEIRAKLNNTFKALEEQRKNVKNSIMQPYEEFEILYKKYVTDKFKEADVSLKSKIDTLEDEDKKKKENEVRSYFDEYKKANDIDFIKFEQADIKMNLSTSLKKLKEQAKQFIDKRIDDLKLIDIQEHKEEILVEYKQSLNVSQAIMTVKNRFKAIEDEKKRQEEIKQKQLEEAKKAADKHISEQTEATRQALENFNTTTDTLEAPKVEEEQEEILELTFTVKGTKTKLKLLKEFLKSGGYIYE